MLSQLINLNLFAFLLIFARLGVAFSVMPGFGSQQVPLPIRLTFALLVTLVVTPVLQPILPLEPATTSALALLISSEVLTGAFLGMIPRIFMGALQTAGTFMAMLASMANAFVMDPGRRAAKLDLGDVSQHRGDHVDFCHQHPSFDVDRDC